MNKIYLTISIVLLALILLVSSCSSKPVTTQKSTTWTWQPTPGGVIPGAQWAFFPAGGANVEAGHTLNLSWSANSNMDCYIFTQTQYNGFMQSGTPNAWVAHGTNSQGTISTNPLQNSDTYYAVLINATTDFGVEVKLFQATLTEQ
jgi:hypothetical protein